MATDDPLQAAQEALERAQKTVAEVTALKERFPDLHVTVDRWARKRYSSKLVNPIADQVDMQHNCGCCADSPLEARPYIRWNGVSVFASPDHYRVGEKTSSGLDDPYEAWEAGMRDYGISETAIQLVGEYFEEQKRKRCAELEQEIEELRIR